MHPSIDKLSLKAIPFFSVFTGQVVGRMDLLNPSGQACASAATCLSLLTYSDGSPLSGDVANHPDVTFDIVSGDYCISVTGTLQFVGAPCSGYWKRPICKFNCFDRKFFNVWCMHVVPKDQLQFSYNANANAHANVSASDKHFLKIKM